MRRRLALVAVGLATAGCVKLPSDEQIERAVFLDEFIKRGLEQAGKNDAKGMNTYFDKAIATAPDNPNVYLNRGYARATLKDYKGAIADQTKAISLDPNLPQAYANRGTSRYRVGEREAARADWRKALELFRKQGNDEQVLELEKVLQQYQ